MRGPNDHHPPWQTTARSESRPPGSHARNHIALSCFGFDRAWGPPSSQVMKRGPRRNPRLCSSASALRPLPSLLPRVRPTVYHCPHSILYRAWGFSPPRFLAPAVGDCCRNCRGARSVHVCRLLFLPRAVSCLGGRCTALLSEGHHVGVLHCTRCLLSHTAHTSAAPYLTCVCLLQAQVSGR